MSPIWKPTILLFAAMILFGAMYIRQPAQSNTAQATATAVVEPYEIMRLVGPLPATVVDAYQ
jgi:hypothetical protein